MRHNRITWFANIEGFLWLSFAAVISQEVGWQDGFWLLIVIPIIGVFLCLSAISAIWNADAAIELLLEKWRIIQDRQSESPYAVIPVIGLSNKELKARKRTPRWHFALFVLLGWIFCLIGVLVTHTGTCFGFPCVGVMSVMWVVAILLASLAVLISFKFKVVRERSVPAAPAKAPASAATTAAPVPAPGEGAGEVSPCTCWGCSCSHNHSVGLSSVRVLGEA